jgi:DNA excision repair protein ERCC-2
MKKKISMSVTEFALPAPRSGSIDAYSGFARGAEVGIEIHQKVQAQRLKNHESYEAEVSVSQIFACGDYELEVNGRMDGIFNNGSTNPSEIRIEEIKTAFEIFSLLRKLRPQQDEHPYCLQLKTYGYFYWLQHGSIPKLNLHLVSSRNEESADLDLTLELRVYEAWLKLRLLEIENDAKNSEKRAKRRKKAAGFLAFPFQKPRSGQVELIETIEEGMRENRPMLIQAPTGLGKTIGVLYPTLKEALKRGQRVVYVTPKNSQHAVAEDAIKRMQETGASLRAMTLTAKSKMCFKNEPICNPEFCEYAKDHYRKVSENQVVEKLSKKRNLTEKVFKKIAEEYQVCPFEIQIDAVPDADVVICDYNYVFAPRSALQRATGLTLDQQGKPNLVIDEAHNLPSRAMDYYSPSLSSHVLEKMRDEVQTLPKKMRAEARRVLEDCIELVKSCGPVGCAKPCKIDPPIGIFLQQDAELRAFLSMYLNSDVEIEPRDVVLRLSFYWSEFTSALEFISSARAQFFTTFSPQPATVRITCCDASEMMSHCYEDYSQVVAFSATFKPFEFYSRLTGLQGKNLKTAEFASPFPRSHRKLLIIPQISSKYSDRERSYPRIAETIEKIIALKHGNYFAFFPSFDFLERVAQQFNPPPGFHVLKQTRGMSAADIREVFASLREPGIDQVVFAVQGGVFSEGVDYPGDMVIGAFVIGPPLPSFDLERESMRAYYEQNYAAGFDYAYTYPAMAKAVQAAGRVIRSETDRGIIILMDSRFIQPSYLKSMPRDWFEQNVRELVSDRILRDISNFWSDSETK